MTFTAQTAALAREKEGLSPARARLSFAALTSAPPHEIQNSDHNSEYDEYNVKSAYVSSLSGNRTNYLAISFKA